MNFFLMFSWYGDEDLNCFFVIFGCGLVFFWKTLCRVRLWSGRVLFGKDKCIDYKIFKNRYIKFFLCVLNLKLSNRKMIKLNKGYLFLKVIYMFG